MEETIYFTPKTSSYPGFLSEKQVGIHFEKHHLGYLRAIKTKLGELTKEEFITQLNRNKTAITPLANNLRQVFLHNEFWKNLLEKFNNLEENNEYFEKINLKTFCWEKIKNLYIFGSGWIIAYVTDGKLQINFFENAQMPPGEIIFVLDLWEHSYYLDHQNRRNDYLEGCKKYLDWKLIYNRLKTADLKEKLFF
jgi:Fe-Mn family superoxide dismutase